MNPEIKIEIDENGEIKIDVNGMKGNSCEDITNQILKALGADSVKSVKKPEYFVEVDQTQIKQRIQ